MIVSREIINRVQVFKKSGVSRCFPARSINVQFIIIKTGQISCRILPDMYNTHHGLGNIILQDLYSGDYHIDGHRLCYGNVW